MAIFTRKSREEVATERMREIRDGDKREENMVDVLRDTIDMIRDTGNSCQKGRQHKNWWIRHLYADNETKGGFVGYSQITVEPFTHEGTGERITAVSFIELVKDQGQGEIRRAWLRMRDEAIDRTLQYVEELEEKLRFWAGVDVVDLFESSVEAVAKMIIELFGSEEAKKIAAKILTDVMGYGVFLINPSPETIKEAENRFYGEDQKDG